MVLQLQCNDVLIQHGEPRWIKRYLRKAAHNENRTRHREEGMNLGGLFVDANNVQEFQASLTILVEGAPGNVMYVVLEGEVELLVH